MFKPHLIMINAMREEVMVRDELGICLSHELLSENLNSTFTHIRAYELQHVFNEDGAHVLLAIPQMQGRDVLHSMVGNKRLIWRADFCCPCYQK
jgi:hypothetical protein